MKRWFCSLMVMWLACGVRPLFAEEATPHPSAQPAVRRTLAFLAADMRAWRTEQGCAACHHGPMYVWASNVARRQGYAVDEPYLAEMTEWLVVNDDARIFRKPTGDSPPKLSQATIFLAHALQSTPTANRFRQPGWQQVLAHLDAAKKSEQGSTRESYWSGPSGRPPIFHSPEIITRLAALALGDEASSTGDARMDAQRRELAARAENWLATHATDESPQGLALRLWGTAGAAPSPPAAPRTERSEALLSRLLEQQRPDGGWAQSADRESDAFATGQALFALSRAGLRSDNRGVTRGIAFLVRTQQPDGTWPMTSRPDPETGKPAENLNPLTYAAASWAVLGLASLQPEREANAPLVAVSSRNKGTAEADGAAQVRPRSPTCPVGECPGAAAKR